MFSICCLLRAVFVLVHNIKILLPLSESDGMYKNLVGM